MRLQAIEGYVGSVRVEGRSAALNARVRKYAQKVRAVRPLTAGALERYVLLVNETIGAIERLPHGQTESAVANRRELARPPSQLPRHGPVDLTQSTCVSSRLSFTSRLAGFFGVVSTSRTCRSRASRMTAASIPIPFASSCVTPLRSRTTRRCRAINRPTRARNRRAVAPSRMRPRKIAIAVLLSETVSSVRSTITPSLG